ncbi:MAG: ABC transporter permease [Planctomycetota bacterium]|nr:MAG: ABC transporter permease [Planctomycetota bacterium]
MRRTLSITQPPRGATTRRACAALLALCAALLALTPSSRAQDDTRPLVIGSKNFTENRILAEILAQLIRAHTDIPVELNDGLGGTLVVFSALREGEIDLYPEYTGTGWAIVLERKDPARDPWHTYREVARAYEERFDIRWLPPFGFSNSYALAVRGELARELGLQSVSDLVPHIAGLRAGVSHEFLNRQDGWPGVSALYALETSTLRGMEHGLAFAALADGDLDLIDAWTTDGKLLRYDITVLRDDKAFWPPYHCAPIVRVDALERHPELEPLLGRLGLRLSNRRMQALNLAVEIDGRSFRDVARDFLVVEGLLERDLPRDLRTDAAAPGERRGSLWEFARARLPDTLRLTGEHLKLSFGAVLAAVLFSVPLGIALARRPHLSQLALNATGVLQTIPSLALLAFMIPVLGLGLPAAYAALFLYALLPILRNTVTGLRGVDAELVDAARGLGLSRRQILRHVELPLALPTIMAGVRTSAIISIGVATLAAFVGAGGLGDPILTGLQLNDMRLVLAGALPAALLAVITDVGLERLERRLTPRGVG